jgi:mono/diheme cytochrome c family protein
MKRRSAVVLCLVFGMRLLAMSQRGSEALFNAKCVNCHGVDGKGSKTTKMHAADLQSKAVQQLTDDQMYDTIAKGTNHKEYPHAFLYQGMSREQIQGLVKYIRTLAKK